LLSKSESGCSLGTAVFLITSGAMFLRNIVILAIFAPEAARIALCPMGSMGIAAGGLLAWFSWSGRTNVMGERLALSSPLSLPRILKFASLFVILISAGTLVDRFLGKSAFLATSALGGLVSGTSTTASIVGLVLARRITAETAAVATVMTSMASALGNAPLLYAQTRDRVLLRRLTGVCLLIAVQGAAVLLLQESNWVRAPALQGLGVTDFVSQARVIKR
jgi:uncharacterized membrane protein (DUF4010 family)